MNPTILFQALEKAGVDFTLIGGLACGIRGVSRLTKDIDIAFSKIPSNATKLAAVINAFEPRLVILGSPEGKPIAVNERMLRKRGILQVQTSIGRIDVLDTIAGFSNYNAVKSCATMELIDGILLRVLTREGLIRSKQALRRPKDISDICELEALDEIERAQQDIGSLSLG